MRVKSKHKKSYFPGIAIFILFLIFIGLIFFQKVWKYSGNFGKSSTETEKTDQTVGWKIYRNPKFGFSIKYPPNLEVVGIEVGVDGDMQEYNFYSNDCCGDTRKPDWMIVFQNKDKVVPFEIFIYQKPASNYLGGIENQKFTYMVKNKNGSLLVDAINLMQSSIQFFPASQNLGCLWSIKTGKVFGENDETMKYFIKTGESKNLRKVGGYYYDRSGNSCLKTDYYTWSGQEQEDSPPFKSYLECVSACTNKSY